VFRTRNAEVVIVEQQVYDDKKGEKHIVYQLDEKGVMRRKEEWRLPLVERMGHYLHLLGRIHELV
jgi:hypothetical protein